MPGRGKDNAGRGKDGGRGKDKTRNATDGKTSRNDGSSGTNAPPPSAVCTYGTGILITVNIVLVAMVVGDYFLLPLSDRYNLFLPHLKKSDGPSIKQHFYFTAL